MALKASLKLIELNFFQFTSITTIHVFGCDAVVPRMFYLVFTLNIDLFDVLKDVDSVCCDHAKQDYRECVHLEFYTVIK